VLVNQPLHVFGQPIERLLTGLDCAEADLLAPLLAGRVQLA